MLVRNSSAADLLRTEELETPIGTHARQLGPVVRGQSRFCLRVQLTGAGARPYAWEIYDDEDTKIVRRSSDTFRTSAEAWTAGTAVLQAPD